MSLGSDCGETSTRVSSCPWENASHNGWRLGLWSRITSHRPQTEGSSPCFGALWAQPRLAVLCLRPTLNATSQDVTHKNFTIPAHTPHPSFPPPLLSQSLIYFIEGEKKKSHSRKEQQPAGSQRQKGTALSVHSGVAASRKDRAVNLQDGQYTPLTLGACVLADTHWSRQRHPWEVMGSPRLSCHVTVRKKRSQEESMRRSSWLLGQDALQRGVSPLLAFLVLSTCSYSSKPWALLRVPWLISLAP